MNDDANSPKYPAIKATLKSGDEPFKLSGAAKSFCVRDFWQWSTSNLISNATRGVLAEFIVAQALKLDLSSIRTEWDDVDLIMPAPTNLKIEVKSASFFQSWDQQKLSTISFGTAKRRADVFVFALLHRTTNKQALDPTELSEWKFYVLSRGAIDGYLGSDSSITLGTLDKWCKEGRPGWSGPLEFDELFGVVSGLEAHA